jgi:hypothetical protein
MTTVSTLKELMRLFYSHEETKSLSLLNYVVRCLSISVFSSTGPLFDWSCTRVPITVSRSSPLRRVIVACVIQKININVTVQKCFSNQHYELP